jgi:hypothetical protein
MVRPHCHPEFPREIVENLAGGSAFIMRLHCFQSCIAQRHCRHRLVTSRRALRTHGRRRFRRRACSPVLPGCDRFPAKSFQNTFGDLQLIELSTQLFSFGIEVLDPFGNPLFFLAYQPSHLLISPLCQVGHHPHCADISNE